VSPGTHIPDGSLAIGTPAKVTQHIETGTTAHRLLETNAADYVTLMERHRAGIRPVG
jgi:carbonic anhydrase/acetyltransferase-like protein (isoleucine patch superfamily)